MYKLRSSWCNAETVLAIFQWCFKHILSTTFNRVNVHMYMLTMLTHTTMSVPLTLCAIYKWCWWRICQQRVICWCPNVMFRRHLHSAATSQLIIPATRCSTLGDRTFPVAAARTWNALSHLVASALTLPTFRQLLKTHLFHRSFYS